MNIIDLSDSNIVITDKNMLRVYNDSFLDLHNCHFVKNDKIMDFNLSTTPEKILELKNELRDKFFFIAGSSNFHHLDIANISRLKTKYNQEMQLVTFDYHMDCGMYYPDINLIHCGNWISYAYYNNMIKKIVIIGSEDYRELKGFFNKSIEDNGDFLYSRNINKEIDIQFLDPNLPVYISIDTDVLRESNDWGKGLYYLESVLNSPVWEQLSNFNIIGACVIGHVTDNRKLWDLLYYSLLKRDRNKINYSLYDELHDYLIYAIITKFFASFSTKPLPLDKQFNIINSFYQKINYIR